jgi:polynucleotide 5'-triphosphatase
VKSTGPRFQRRAIRVQYVNCTFHNPHKSFIILISVVFFQHQHKHYNTLLNRLKTEPPLPSHVGSPLDYSHRYLVDSFYAVEGNDKEKIRVTRDEKTGTTLECMRKLRLGNLNIYSPKNAADWRVSVNLEIPSTLIFLSFNLNWVLLNISKSIVQHPVGAVTHSRRKDRVSYSHEEFSIDLTQVTSKTSPNVPVRSSHLQP